MLNSSSRNMASVRLGGSDRKVDPSSTGLTLSDDDVFGAVGVKIGCSSRDAEIDGVENPTEHWDRTASAVREGVAGRQKRESELMRGDARGSKLRLRGGGCGPSKSSSDPDTGEDLAARGDPVQAKEQTLELISPKSVELQLSEDPKLEQALELISPKSVELQLSKSPKFEQTLELISPKSVELQLSEDPKLELEPVQRMLLKHLFAGCSNVKVAKLHGGFSGSLVLGTQSFDMDGRPEEPTVTKLDGETEMRREVEQTRYIKQKAGEGVIQILREPVYVERRGAVLLEMAGACWVMPEFFNKCGDGVELISTLKKRVTAQLVSAGLEVWTDRGVAVDVLEATLRALWSAGSPLSNLALKTVRREEKAACDEAGGRVRAWLSELVERLAALFLPPETGAAIRPGCESPLLADELHSIGVHLDPSKHAKRFKTSFVHELGREVWGDDKSLPLRELLLLLKELATPESRLAAWRPLICHAHGDLNFGNVLIDARDDLWLIDVR